MEGWTEHCRGAGREGTLDKILEGYGSTRQMAWSMEGMGTDRGDGMSKGSEVCLGTWQLGIFSPLASVLQ